MTDHHQMSFRRKWINNGQKLINSQVLSDPGWHKQRRDVTTRLNDGQISWVGENRDIPDKHRNWLSNFVNTIMITERTKLQSIFTQNPRKIQNLQQVLDPNNLSGAQTAVIWHQHIPHCREQNRSHLSRAITVFYRTAPDTPGGQLFWDYNWQLTK